MLRHSAGRGFGLFQNGQKFKVVCGKRWLWGEEIEDNVEEEERGQMLKEISCHFNAFGHDQVWKRNLYESKKNDLVFIAVYLSSKNSA